MRCHAVFVEMVNPRKSQHMRPDDTLSPHHRSRRRVFIQVQVPPHISEDDETLGASSPRKGPPVSCLSQKHWPSSPRVPPACTFLLRLRQQPHVPTTSSAAFCLNTASWSRAAKVHHPRPSAPPKTGAGLGLMETTASGVSANMM